MKHIFTILVLIVVTLVFFNSCKKTNSSKSSSARFAIKTNNASGSISSLKTKKNNLIARSSENVCSGSGNIDFVYTWVGGGEAEGMRWKAHFLHHFNLVMHNRYPNTAFNLSEDGSYSYYNAEGDISSVLAPIIGEAAYEANQTSFVWATITNLTCYGNNSCSPVVEPEPTTPPLNWESEYYRKIDTNSLSDCFKKAFKSIKSQSNDMAQILKTFGLSSTEFPGHNWKLVSGSLPPNINGLTLSKYDSANQYVKTTFDDSKFTNATDLAVARTLMHESAHAFLVSYFRNDPLNAIGEFHTLVEAWGDGHKAVLNIVHHNEFVNLFVQRISNSLTELGNSKGYVFDSAAEKEEYYLSLAWGGLTDTDAFKGLSTSIQNRILDILSIEQYGVDRLGNPVAQKGTPSGC